MSALLPSRLRGAPSVLACLLLAGAAGCQPNDGMVGAPDPGTPPPAPATGVKGVVFLTHDMSSEGVPVLMVWQEVRAPEGVGGGVEAGISTVPVPAGALPADARVQGTVTDEAGRFVHPRTREGGVTLRLGALPENCRRPPDQVVDIVVGRYAEVRIDVLCYGPKPPPPPPEY